jgi:hypothetical protein
MDVAVRLGVMYDSVGNNMREGGLTSCSSRSRKLRSFTWKELETVKAAKKLFGAPTIGGGSVWAGGGGRESQRRQIGPQLTKTTKWCVHLEPERPGAHDQCRLQQPGDGYQRHGAIGGSDGLGECDRIRIRTQKEKGGVGRNNATATATECETPPRRGKAECGGLATW